MPSYSAPGTHPSQYRNKLHRRRGRLRARGHPQGDDDLRPQVRRRPMVFAFLSAPVDRAALSPSLLRPSPCSLCGNHIRDEGASALAAVLKETQITNLKCAAAPECLLSCQRPLTHLRSHLIHSVPRFTVSGSITSATRPNRRSTTPRAAASTSSSSRRSHGVPR